MGNQESKDESMGCNCSSSSCSSSSSFCGACPQTMTANCHGVSFEIAEKSSISDINRFGKFYLINNLLLMNNSSPHSLFFIDNQLQF